MRHLASNSNLADLPEPLRREVAACLQRWQTSSVPVAEDEAPVILVEPGDTLATVAALLGEVADDDFVLPAEWVSDLGCALEGYVCWGADGQGVSLLIPKADSTDPVLLAHCLDLVSSPPG